MSQYTSINKQLDPKRAKVIVAGLDSGAVTSKAVILLDGEPYAFSQVTNRTPKEGAARAIEVVLNKTGLKLHDIHFAMATGRGRAQVPFAQQTISEIACGAAGAVYVWGPTVRTVLDAGGQSCRVIQCTEKGKASSFLWNDKCAAGIGRSMEAFADLVKKGLAEMANITLQSDKFPKLSDFCAVYAQSEALDLMRSKVPVEEVIAGYHQAMAKRISTLLARAGVKKDFVIIGGLARNRAIVDLVEKKLKVTRLAPQSEWTAEWAAEWSDGSPAGTGDEWSAERTSKWRGWDPALTVALGAALCADRLRRGHS